MRKPVCLVLLLLSSAFYACQQSRSEETSTAPQSQTVKPKPDPVPAQDPTPEPQPPTLSSHAEAEYDSFLNQERLPYWVNEWFMENKEFVQKYTVSDSLNPFYLEGDFNGDKNMDCAVYLKESKSNKKGFVILHGKTQKHFIIAAGVAYNHVDRPCDDLDWMNIWRVEREKFAAPGVQGGPTLKLKGDAISIEESETGGGLIYWDGKGYKYFHQTC